MKKLMTVLAACIVAGLVNAQSVTSANMVGYQAISTAGQTYNMLAVNWQKVGTGPLAMQDLFDVSALTGGQGPGTADNIIIWDPVTSGYSFYWLYGGGTGIYAANNGKWIDPVGNPVTSATTVTNGSAFWLLRQGAGTVALNIAGQVPSDSSVALAIKSGTYNMIGNPYPTALSFNGTNLVVDLVNAVGGQGPGTADNIIVWDPNTSGYAFYWLYGGGTGVYAANNGKWIDPIGNPATDALAMGTGAWYLSRGNTDWTLTINKTY